MEVTNIVKRYTNGITHCFVKLETEWRVSKEGQFWKLETWKHWKGDRENVIFYKQKWDELPKNWQIPFLRRVIKFLPRGRQI